MSSGTRQKLSRLPGHLKLVNILSEFFHKTLRRNPLLRKLFVSLGSGIFSVDELDTARTELDDLVEPVRQNCPKFFSAHIPAW